MGNRTVVCVRCSYAKAQSSGLRCVRDTVAVIRKRTEIMLASVVKFLKSEDGPTAVEYAVMLALIVIVCLTAIRAVGTNANARFNQVSNQLT